MRIVVMGAGGVGGYFGAYLAQAGHDVAFVARGAHLDALQRDGLRLEGSRGDIVLPKVTATEDPASLGGTADVILFAVKLYDTETAGVTLMPVVGPETMVVTLQNGVDGPDRLASVLGGAAYVSALIAEPGVVRYTSDMSKIVFGELDGTQSERARRLADACIAAGFSAEVSGDIRATLWEKFVLLATNSALTTVLRQPAGEIYHDGELSGIAREMMEEVAGLAAAEGISIHPETVDRSLALTRSFPPGMYASMYHDLARGRRIEAESLSGLVSRLGRARGVPVPLHTMAWAAMKPWVNGG
ncbi:ketopantoate reductase family protein [Thalassobaculum litoreum]|uniref:2-dehydropantoate 2-reductase n=1 Tax=Thalassobaculum litoreum DSM 18839 TaxID=1123362 RepID=A0A8G2BG25_9PROT|nr:2-dehydropantoate 2-reductase [Thalassobaculum litoreum]SDF16840.1 2-dehydropantoate 2-reductase [Thalassobaculum litoreum DSM 18839]